jgi:two-component system nitrogen regulation sensor histidine kinase GlnL
VEALAHRVAEEDAVINPRTVLEQLTSGVVLVDAQLIVTSVNQSAESLLGTSRNHLVGRVLADIPALAGRADTARRCLVSGQPITERAIALGQTPADVQFSPLSDGDGLIIEILALNRQLARADQAIRDRQQRALDELLRGLAHEIKNPLGGLRGAAQLLQRQLDDSELWDYTRVIIAEADRLAALVDRFQRPRSAPEFQPVNVHDVLEHVAALTLAAHGEELQLLRDYDPSIPEIVGDRDSLVQLMLNLINNAVEAGAAHITLVSCIGRGVTIGARDHRSAVSLGVIDDAGGVPENLRELVFIPLVSGRSDGTGLGLAIAQRIASEHRGIVRFDDCPGGTRFSCLLPLPSNEEEGG